NSPKTARAVHRNLEVAMPARARFGAATDRVSLVISPDFIAVGISEACAGADAHFLSDGHGLGILRASVTGLLSQLAGDGVALGENVILRTTHRSPFLEQLHVRLQTIRLLFLR